MAAQKTVTVDNGVDLEELTQTVQKIKENPEAGKCKFRVKNRWLGGAHNQTHIQDFHSVGQEFSHKRQFELHADEPSVFGGTDEGANPVEHLLNALAACVTTSMVAHAAVRGIEVQEVESELEGDIDIRGFLGLDENVPKGYKNIRINFKVKTAPQNIDKLKELAKFSPVYNTITNGADVEINIQPK